MAAETTLLQEPKKFHLEKPMLIFILMFLLLFVMSVKPSLSKVVTLLFAPLMLWMFFYDEFYLLIGIFIFYSEQLAVGSSLPLMRVYSSLVLLKILFSKRKVGLNLVTISAMFVILLYCGFAVMNADTSTIVNEFVKKNLKPPSDLVINLRLMSRTVMDMFFAYLIAQVLNSDTQLFRRFLVVFVCAALVAGVYGFFADNIFNYDLGMDANTGKMVTIQRYMGTYNDPNYFGFYLNLAVFATMLSPAFKKLYIKIPLLLVLYYLIVASGSLTALICNVLAWCVFIVLRYKQKAAVILVVTAIVGAGGYLSMTTLPVVRDLSVVQSLQQRMESQFSDMFGADEKVDADALTSGRSRSWRYYLKYFGSQELTAKLFGGNIVMSSSIDPKFIEENNAAPHQVYIQFLLNFGILGTIVMMLCFLIKGALYLARYIKDQEDIVIMFLMSTFMWLFYGSTLDYFPNLSFMLFYFL